MNRNIYENLRFVHVCVLLDTLSTTRLDRTSHIRRLFSESAEGFDEVVSFLSRLGMIVSEGQSLRLDVDWMTSDTSLRRSQVMQRLMSKRNRYRSEIFRFVNQFRVLDGELAYLSSTENRSAESGVRNFLMDVGIVGHVMGTEKYVLMPEYASVFASARDNANYVSPSLLEKNAADRSEIGYAAEELIVEHERSRVGSGYSDRIDHISTRNCAAGYDIRSVSLEADGEVVPRFIEVKAVSSVSFQFYWSLNEVNVARILSHWYHLYLLPVDRHGHFNIADLKVIIDPCNTVLPEDSDWATESNVLICYIKANMKS